MLKDIRKNAIEQFSCFTLAQFLKVLTKITGESFQ